MCYGFLALLTMTAGRLRSYVAVILDGVKSYE